MKIIKDVKGIWTITGLSASVNIINEDGDVNTIYIRKSDSIVIQVNNFKLPDPQQCDTCQRSDLDCLDCKYSEMGKTKRNERR
jgi:hypothetical protein